MKVMTMELTMRSYVMLGVFIVGVFAIGSIIGISFAPGTWYESLKKPFFNPPNWLFGPAWAVLYILIGIAGWRSFQQDTGGIQSVLWLVQMGLNFLWSPVVFGAQMLWPGVAVIAAMLLTIFTFIVVAWNNQDQTSAWLFVPYAAWVSFAALLNTTLAVMNPNA